MPSELANAFVDRVRERLSTLGSQSLGLRVSVADEAVWESSGDGDRVLVRWVCWNVVDHGKQVGHPEFEVLSQRVTREQLAEELPNLFPGIEVVVDNDIDPSIDGSEA